MAYDTLTRSVLSTLSFDAERSRLELGGAPFGFHADAYNTRVLRICEDMMGYQEAGRLLYECAEATTYELLKKTLLDGPGKGEFQALSLTERLEAVFEIYKALAYGAILVAAASPDRARFTSASSYLAEGWLENKERWHLDDREGPACHDICGHIAAAMAVAAGKPPGSYRVTEVQCRSYRNGALCEFLAEVR